jgi:hypothetical protein
MADTKHKDRDAEIRELGRAVNAQARLLAEIVKAADHIVKAYIEITKIQEPTDEKDKEVKKDSK